MTRSANGLGSRPGSDFTPGARSWSNPADGLPRAARLVEVRSENHRTRTFVLDAQLDARPGQFAMLWLPGLDEKPFSLLDADPLAFTIAAVGPFTRALHTLVPGDRLWFRGPYGTGFAPRGRDHLLVGGGYGAAPLLLLAREMLGRGDRVRLVLGARTERELLLVDAARDVGAEVHVTTDDGSAGTRGRVTDVVGPMVTATGRPDTLYACGPHPMLHALEALCLDRELPAQLSWEAYMRCAIGICGSCEHDGRLLCADGPVLESQAPAARVGRR